MQDSPATLQTSASSSSVPQPAATTLVDAGPVTGGATHLDAVAASTSSLAAAAAVAAAASSSSSSASSSSSSVAAAAAAAANGHDAKQHNGFTSTGTTAAQVGSASSTTTTNSSSGSVNNNNNNNNYNVNVQSGGGGSGSGGSGGNNNNNNNAANSSSNNVIVGPQSNNNNNNRDGSMLNNSNNTSNNSPSTQVAANNLQLDKGNQEIIRLIGQYLQDIGLEKSVKTLFSESGCRLEHPAATKFREHVISGDWLKADADLKELEHLIEDCKPQKLLEMKFILLEQKYLEYLEDGCPLDALNVLRNELTPLQHKISRVHQLSSFMMCSNAHDLHQRAKWDGKGILSRTLVMERLQTFLPPSVMMPPRRLRGLLQQAVGLQTQHCLFHNMAWETNLQNVSLLTDHCCATDGFPMQTIQILNDHCDEVWICKFSPDGLKLATGSKDTTVIIWDVDPYKLTLKLRRILGGQSQMSVAFVSWSPDSKLLLVGGPDDSPEVYIWNVDDGKLVMKMLQSMEDSLSCGAFNRDGTRFVCGGIKGQFYLCDLNGTILESWEGVRINYVNFRSDNKTILASDSHFRIRGYNFDSPRSDFDILKEPHAIMTFTVNSNDRLALLNVSNQGLHLWDMKDRCLVRRFQGIRQNNFAIHSCFGGVNESFVASGSEDKLVCIWHIKREQPLAKLEGHTKTVNCVSWNPVYPQLLASASDDATVRIWGPKPHCGANATPESDDCSSSCSSSSSWNMTS